jgi:dTDP-4-dehydrorhamnose reductase
MRADADTGDRPVLIAGAAGQLGRAMVRGLAAEWRPIGLTRTDLDLSDAAAVYRMVGETRPWAIVNCAGYNHVDRAESEPIAALEANAIAVMTLARAAESVGATLVHYSSDFVFDGETDRPYVEDDRPEPRSTYAASKLAGEWFAAGAASHYVLRVESLFGGAERRKSSMDRIIDAVLAGGPARVFVDRVVSPSYVWDVVTATAAILNTRPAAGLYHCVNTGAATWHDLAVEVRRQAGNEATLEKIELKDVKSPAERPRYCALSNDKLLRAGIAMPPWQDAIGRALAERRTTNEERRTTNAGNS